MADTKISNMTAASALSGAELVAGVQSGGNVKITTAQIATLADATALVIGTTPITSGTTGRLLYDNAAVLGEALLTYSAAVLQLGAADATVPVVQTLKAQSGLTGSGSNIGGPDLTIQPGLGTGFGTTSTYGLGRVLFSTPVQKATGATIQTYATVAAIGPQTITSATSNPVLDLNQTWNNASLAATGILLNVTDTSSNGNSLLMDLQVGGASKFSVVKTGAVTSTALTVATAAGITASTAFRVTNTTNTGFMYASADANGARLTFGDNNNGLKVRIDNDSGFTISSNSSMQWTNGDTNATVDVTITRAAAATLLFGSPDAAAAVAQAFKVQSVVAGTTNTAGANWTMSGSIGTGTGAGGQIILRTAPAGNTGTAQNALATALTLTAPAVSMQPSVVVGNQAVATTATDGFLYIPTCAGTPTGVPTTFAGRIAMIYDTTAHQFWFYDSGWKQPKTPAAAAIITWQ